MKADGIAGGFLDPLPALCDQLVGAPQFLAVVAEHQASFVDQAERADISAVIRG